MKNQSASVSFLYEFKSFQCPERSYDRVTRSRLERYDSSSFMGCVKLFIILLFVMLSISVLTNEVCIAWIYSFLVLV